jgi:3-hexulose-6-phosphate synthase
VSDSVAVLADLKIMDAGEHEAELAFSAGADIVTVLGVAHDETIQGVVRAARRAGGGTKEVMVDLINTVDPAARAAQVAELGVDIVYAPPYLRLR